MNCEGFERVDYRILDFHCALLPGDELHRLLRIIYARRGSGFHAPRLSRKRLSDGALMGQGGRRSFTTPARVSRAGRYLRVEGMGLRRICHQPYLGDHRSLRHT